MDVTGTDRRQLLVGRPDDVHDTTAGNVAGERAPRLGFKVGPGFRGDRG